MSNKTAVRKMAFCMILIVLMTAAYQAFAQESSSPGEATPEVVPEATAVPEAPPDTVIVNVETPPSYIPPEAGEGGIDLATVVLIFLAGGTFGGGGVFAFSRWLRGRIEESTRLMDSLERVISRWPPRVRAVFDQGIKESDGWSTLYRKMNDGALSDGTKY